MSTEVVVTRIGRYKGKPTTLYFKVRSNTSRHIPEEWAHGAIRLDMTKIKSASFGGVWCPIKYNEKDKTFHFTLAAISYQVTEELVAVVDKFNTDYHLFNHIPQPETKIDHEE